VAGRNRLLVHLHSLLMQAVAIISIFVVALNVEVWQGGHIVTECLLLVMNKHEGVKNFTDITTI
jgi:hypothetical protein